MRFSSVKCFAAIAFVVASAPRFLPTTLSINTALTTADPLYKGLESFRDAVAKRSNGAIEVKLFPNSQLGSDEDVLEQARAGAPVAVVVDGGRLPTSSRSSACSARPIWPRATTASAR